MAIWGKLFGSDKIIGGLMDAGDKVFYTDEEKADNHRLLLKLYEPFKIAQRYLAVIFGVPFAFLHTIAFSWRMYAYDNAILQKAVSAIQADMNSSLGLIVSLIIGFYFGGGAIEGIVRKLKDK